MSRWDIDLKVFQAEDLVTIGLLVILEGLLSADNALVPAVMILGLHSIGVIHVEVDKWLSFGLIVVIFSVAISSREGRGWSRTRITYTRRSSCSRVESVPDQAPISLSFRSIVSV